jgi:hypothetical protein
MSLLSCPLCQLPFINSRSLSTHLCYCGETKKSATILTTTHTASQVECQPEVTDPPPFFFQQYSVSTSADLTHISQTKSNSLRETASDDDESIFPTTQTDNAEHDNEDNQTTSSNCSSTSSSSTSLDDSNTCYLIHSHKDPFPPCAPNGLPERSLMHHHILQATDEHPYSHLQL